MSDAPDYTESISEATLREARIANYLKAIELLSMTKSTPSLVPKEAWGDLQEYVAKARPLKHPDTREGFTCFPSSCAARLAPVAACGLVNASRGE